MANSRKYPYTMTEAFWNSEGKGGLIELEFWRRGGVLTSGILKA